MRRINFYDCISRLRRLDCVAVWLCGYDFFSNKTVLQYTKYTKKKLNEMGSCACLMWTSFSRGAFKEMISNKWTFWWVYLLKLRSDGSRLSEPLDIIAAIEKSVPFLAAAATAAAAAVVLQWFEAPSSIISIEFYCYCCFGDISCFFSRSGAQSITLV